MKTLVKTYLDYDPIPPSVIYHYCTAETMLSILSNNCLWLSDSTKTNDQTEINWLLDNISQVFDEVLLKYKSEFDENILLKVKGVVEQILNRVILYKIPNAQQKKKFLTCFSENGDLLSQWRAYGNNGCGISIGFDGHYFDMFRNGGQYEFAKVIYDLDKTKHFLHKVIDKEFKYIIMDCIEHDTFEKGSFNLSLQLSILIDSIYQEGFIFKNQYFHEENEWRLYRNVSSSNYDKSDGVDDYGYSEFIEGIFADNKQYLGDFSRSKLKFRATDSDIKCYMEIGFEKIKSKIIKEIIIGPKCNINLFDLKLYLVENKYLEDIADDSIQIRRSRIPFI